MNFVVDNNFPTSTPSVPHRVSERVSLNDDNIEVRKGESQRFNRLRQSSVPLPTTTSSHKNFLIFFNIPSHVSPADIASHFPNASSHFPMGGLSKIPIAFEQAHRFDGLVARREALIARQTDRLDKAARRRKEFLIFKQQPVSYKMKNSSRAMIRTKQNAHRKQQPLDHDVATIGSKDGTVLNASLAGQLKSWISNLFGNTTKHISNNKSKSTSSSNPSSNEIFPFSYELTMSKPSLATVATQEARWRARREGNLSHLLCYVSPRPDYINISALERRFRHSAAKINQFDESRSHSSDILMPIRDEENLRFDQFYAYRERIADRDQQRQKESGKRSAELKIQRQQLAKKADQVRRLKVLCSRLSQETALKKQQLITGSFQLLAETRRRQFLLNRTLTLKYKFNEVIWKQIESKKLCAIEEELQRQQKRMSVARNRRKQIISERVNIIKSLNARRAAKVRVARKNMEKQQKINSEVPEQNTSSASVVSTATTSLVSTLSILASKTLNTITQATSKRSLSQSGGTDNDFNTSLKGIERESDSRRCLVEKSESSLREGMFEAFKAGKIDIRQREIDAFLTRKRLFEEKAQAKMSVEVQRQEFRQSFVTQLRNVEADETKKRYTSIVPEEARDFKKLLNDQQFEKKLTLERLEQQKIEIATLQAKLYAINKEIDTTAQQLKEKVGSRPLMIPVALDNNASAESHEALPPTDFLDNANEMRPSSALRITTTVGGFQAQPTPPVDKEGPSAEMYTPTVETAGAVNTAVQTQPTQIAKQSDEQQLINMPSTLPNNSADKPKTTHEEEAKPKQEKIKNRKFCC